MTLYTDLDACVCGCGCIYIKHCLHSFKWAYARVDCYVHVWTAMSMCGLLCAHVDCYVHV